MSTQKEPPVVRTRSRGQVSTSLETYAKAYRDRYPDRDVRYVYDPSHKPELSGVLGRKAQGYQIVTLGEAGLASTSDEEDNPVRVGDLVLMSIDKKTRGQLRKEVNDKAAEQRLSVDRQFREAVNAAAEAADKEGHTRAPVRPVGRASIEEREREYEIEQRGEDKER